MKKHVALLVFFVSILVLAAPAQERFGGVFNFGLGIGGYAGYYNYVGRTVPVLSLNYEFAVVPNFTLAPFASVSTYANDYYWGNKNNPYRYYTYRETIIPVGVKASYYFDELLNAGAKWDFYLSGSLGFALINTRWDSGFDGNRQYYRRGNPLFLDLHIGSEYHLNERLGVFLDLSTGVSTLGLAVHTGSTE